MRLADYAGRNVVLFFYPEDDTGGCTREACGFRDAKEQFDMDGAAIFGVSTDDVESHRAFTEKFNLNFPLLVDSDRTICQAFGVAVEGNWADRVTFLIGKDGRVKKVWGEVHPVGHAAEVYQAIQELGD